MPNPTQIQFDLQTTLFDQLSSDKFIKPQFVATQCSNDELRQKLQQSLNKPLHYPPLSESVFAGDKVAVVLQNGLPQALSLLGLLLELLFEAGIEQADIIVIVHRQSAAQFGFNSSQIEEACDPDSQEAPLPLSQSVGGNAIQFQIHNGNNESAVAYLAANEAGEPIHVNRALVDADVILPIGFPFSGDPQQQTDCVYPEYASVAVQTRFSSDEMSPAARREEIQLANDTLGLFFAIQIVSGPGGNIENICSGVRGDVMDQARSQTNALWEFDWPHDIDITVATIETTIGGPSWEDFSNALLTATHLSSDNGPIVIWSELAGRPGRAIRNALLAQFDEYGDKKLTSQQRQLASVLQEHPVYLYSKLSRNEVEGLGLGYIDSVAEVNRIAAAWQSGFVLRDAHRRQISGSTFKAT